MERLAPLPWQSDLWTQLADWRDRLPHAVLLHGGRGIGKRHVAQAFAQLLLCEAPRGTLACGTCASCQLIAADNHPDLRWLMPAADMPAREDDGEEADEGADPVDAPTAAGKPKKAPSREIVIDQVRRIGDFLGVSSHRGGRRVVLLAPAEALNGPAANALLKMLEEPPTGAVFLGVSDQIDAVLPTIRSRCVLVRVPAPPWPEALRWLRDQGVEDAEARLAEAGGAPLGIVAEETVDERRRLGPEVRAALLTVLARGTATTPADVVAAVPRDVAVGPAIRLFQRWGWDLLGERVAQRVRYHPGQKRALATLARAVDPPRLVDWLATLTEAQAVSEHPLNARLAVERALLGYLDALQGTGTNR
ncbi:MAG TPA: DNA polymerase III subunit delta' [Burkholderiaceae bacterium]|nr:DNA polymerase III subunit delta' [Burkholderiaceae bacterium]